MVEKTNEFVNAGGEIIPQKIMIEIEQHVKENKLGKAEEKHLLEKIRALYSSIQYDAEEAIGVVAAQSLSEPTTQMTMRTYHFAGTAGIQVTLGLPRFLEIFDARKEPKTPTMMILLDKEHQSADMAKKVAEMIREVKLKNAVQGDVIDLSNLEIRFKIDLAKLAELGVEPESLPKKVKIRNVKASLDGDELVVSSEKIDVKNLRKLKFKIGEIHIKGIKGISQAIVTKESDEWMISTLGSDLVKVFEIKGVDPSRTTSNNIFEIYETLGVEAARTVIYQQAMHTITEQGLGVDIRYPMLLADLMTYGGKIKAIGRYGIAGQKHSVLARMAFEETRKHLTTAAIKGEIDDFHGVVENIMVNQTIPVGTGAFELIGKIPEKK